MVNQHVKLISVDNGYGERSTSLEEKINLFLNSHPEYDILKIDYAAVSKGVTNANTKENTINYSALIWYKIVNK